MEKETPKLHGWITPEYAMKMVIDLLAFLEKHGYEINYDIQEIDDLGTFVEIDKKCPFTYNVHDAIS